MIHVGDIVRYFHPTDRHRRVATGDVIAVDDQFVTVDGEVNGMRMGIRVRLDRVWLDEQMMRILKRKRGDQC